MNGLAFNWRILPRRYAPILGLDLSPSGIKMAEISGDPNKGFRVDRFGSFPLAKGLVADGNIDDVEQVAHAVRGVLNHLRCKTKEVALALPSSAVISKRIQVSSGLSERELESQVDLEAAQYIPFPIEEVNLDFQVLGPHAHDPDQIDVLLVAARKDKVDERVAVAEQAGLKASVVDVESFAGRAAIEQVAKTLPRGGEEQTIAVIDIGQSVTRLQVVIEGDAIFEREHAFGGNQLTQEIVRTYGITVEDAEMKKRYGGLPDNYEAELVQPFLEQVASEVSRALQFFYSSTSHARVDHIFLCGGVSVMPGLPQAVAKKIQTKVRVLNPFHGMQLAVGLDEEKFRAEAPTMLVACGLALRRFDR